MNGYIRGWSEREIGKVDSFALFMIVQVSWY